MKKAVPVVMSGYWVIFHSCLSSADFSQNQLFLKISFRNRVSNSLDLDQARHFVGSDLGPNCFQSLSADNKSRLRVKSPAATVADNLSKTFFIFQDK